MHDEIDKISLQPLQAYLSDKMQLFDVIEEVLLQIGPSKLFVTSFSISEEFIRKMVVFKNKGLILYAELIIDRYESGMLTSNKMVFDHLKILYEHLEMQSCEL